MDVRCLCILSPQEIEAAVQDLAVSRRCYGLSSASPVERRRAPAGMFQKVPAPDRLTRKVKTVLARTSHRLAALGSVFVLLLPHDEGIHTNTEMATR